MEAPDTTTTSMAQAAAQAMALAALGTDSEAAGPTAAQAGDFNSSGLSRVENKFAQDDHFFRVSRLTKTDKNFKYGKVPPMCLNAPLAQVVGMITSLHSMLPASLHHAQLEAHGMRATAAPLHPPPGPAVPMLSCILLCWCSPTFLTSLSPVATWGCACGLLMALAL